MAIKTRGRFSHSFTITSNILRDEWIPLVGTDAVFLAFVILSYGNSTKGARLSSRYFRRHFRWGEDRAQSAKSALLAHLGCVFTRVPGDQKTSTPETWWVDLDVLEKLHDEYVARVTAAKNDKNRGPGRPKKPVPVSRAGYSAPSGIPALEFRTGFPAAGHLFTENLPWNSRQPRPGIPDSPAPETGTHKENSKELPEKNSSGGECTASTDTTTPDNRITEHLMPPVGGAADTATAELPSPEQKVISHPAGHINQATGIEEVPAAAAAILGRELGGKRKLGEFLAQVPPALQRAGVTRDRWLHIPPEQLETLLVQAKARAYETNMSSWTCIIRALDEAVGARIGSQGQPGEGGHRRPLRTWRVGDRVMLARCTYTIEGETETYLDLYDEINGSIKVTRHSNDYDRLRLVATAITGEGH